MTEEKIYQYEGNCVDRFMKLGTEPFDDYYYWGDDGGLEVYLGDNIIETYTRADLIEAGIFEDKRGQHPQ